ncbi:MAG: TIGR02757 family protein [Deferribacteraceae bacterium]|jgi:uncharacterized protein (TIGR02757 family)|nr:TIGR02757 family protein [Deferribacteraceae bacterium]
MKSYFEHLYRRYNTKKFISTDPIQFPHNTDGNREFIAFTAALFAYGNVKAMQKFLTAFFERCGTDPFKLEANPANLKYRFQTGSDVADYCLLMKRIYQENGSLEQLFVGDAPMEAAAAGVKAIRDKYISEMTQGLNFLFALPGKSTSKRLSMYLRWMIRKDEVDFGLWKSFSPAFLYMPVDTHIQRLSLKMGIILPGDKGVAALNKVNAFFRELNPYDPVKYDFALTRLGIAFNCSYERSQSCVRCAENDLCAFQ